MRSRLFWLIVLFLAAASIGRPATAAPPNFVLCMADDQGWGDVAYNGHPALQTPVLDEMAATGLRFDRFYAAHPVCSPTRGSVMTGRNPNRYACFSWGYTLRPEEITIAEALKSVGYATGHFGKWHIGSCQANDAVSPGRSGFDRWVSSPNFYENNPLFSKNGRVIETQGESSEVTVRHALEFIREQAAANQPFLAVIWFGNPHTPHQAVDELKALYPGHTRAEQNYYGEITGIDRAMGRLRQGLREAGIADDTLLWYTSDNGPQARSPGSSGGLRDAKGSVWEGGLRVPTIIEWPAKVTSPRSSEVPAVTSDIFPTLTALAGVKLPHQPLLDGVDLTPLIEGKMTSRAQPIGFWRMRVQGIPAKSTELLQALREEQQAGRDDPAPPARSPESLMTVTFPLDDRPGHAAWLDGDWKLHRLPSQGGEFTYELYNLKSDREERNDVAADNQAIVARMTAQLEAWQKSVLGSLNGDDYPR